MVDLRGLVAVAGCEPHAIDNWTRRKMLSLDEGAGRQGVVRKFSRAAALQIVFMAALTGAGVEASRASRISENWVMAERKGQLLGTWVANPLGQLWIAQKTDGVFFHVGPSLSELWEHPELSARLNDDWTADVAHDVDEPASTIILIRLDGIIEKVDRLFRESN